MSTPSTPAERRLRAFCRVLAAVVCVGAAIELWLVEHTNGFQQWIPFGMCGIVFVSVLLVSFRQSGVLIRVHRLLMVLVIAGSAYGVYLHLSRNMTFAREIRPSSTQGEIWLAGIRGGNPLLAPGMFALAASLGIAGAAPARS